MQIIDVSKELLVLLLPVLSVEIEFPRLFRSHSLLWLPCWLPPPRSPHSTSELRLLPAPRAQEAATQIATFSIQFQCRSQKKKKTKKDQDAQHLDESSESICSAAK